ncbi:hypothetical protein HYE12_04950 [Mycoplasmopsis bovis]|uniref:hypothetical protein n=1 Tax=Mycoplasmopsis bovis TaxID=28903 RepID=UPI0027A879DE|nr:hypothetical protein HYE12_04950 [Mycoplasmopsis bovis]
MFKNSSAPQLNFTLIGVALELTIKQEAYSHFMLLLFLIKAYKTTDLDDNTFRLLYLFFV